MAKAKTMNEPEVKLTGETKLVYIPLNPKVKGDAPMFASVNGGKRYMIRRGEMVELPIEIAEVVENSIESDLRTQRMIEKLEADYLNSQA